MNLFVGILSASFFGEVSRSLFATKGLVTTIDRSRCSVYASPRVFFRSAPSCW